MRIGTVRERKDGEQRVGLTPLGARVLRDKGHEVRVQTGAGAGSGFADDDYRLAGATILATAGDVWDGVDLVVKVKEPIAEEFGFLRHDCALFTYLHLATARPLTERLLASGCRSLAYEMATGADGSHPLLAPMSQVAGRMAAEMGAHLLKKPGPGRGKLLGGITGVARGKAIVVGSGVVATAAVHVLVGLGAEVSVLAPAGARLNAVSEQFGGLITTRVANSQSIAEEVAGADLAILGVLVPGAAAPKVVTREMVRSMGEGAVVIDVSIDQGGAAETSRPTTHSQPTYVDEGVVHYCVTNMPGAVPRTSTEALTSATLPFVTAIADHGLDDALKRDRTLAAAVSTWDGGLVTAAVAELFGIPASPNPFLA